MTTLDAKVIECAMMFDATMEIWKNLQEDPNLQKMHTNVRETQNKCEEI